MSSSDKARFYLEASVPELQDYLRKKIFSKSEVSAIAKKRSDFEHKLNAPGQKPIDYARYAEYEINLGTLRKKREKRLGVKAPSYTESRRVFFILDRGTRRFPGDLALWIQYIGYTRQQKAHKRTSQILTDALRLHPNKSELWVYAAKVSLDDHGDMTMARTYMQRGLRFCKNSKELWVGYGQLEMIYIAKIAARRRILGLDEVHTEHAPPNSTDDMDADMIALPSITGEDINPSLDKDDEIDQGALQNLDLTPALSGAIPIAVFDAGMKQFKDDAAFAHEFFDMVHEYEDVPCLRKILEHLVEKQVVTSPESYHTEICFIREPVVGIRMTSPEFPKALGTSLSRLKKYHVDRNLGQEIVKWLQPMLETEELDPALRTVIIAMLQRSQHVLQDRASSEK